MITEKTFTLRDGTVLTYDSIGEGRPVLFLHGVFGDRTSYWRHIIPQIGGTKYTAIALDQRGSGDTSASLTRPVTEELLVDDLHDFLVGNDLKQTTLVGSSLGGSEILWYFNKYGCDPYVHSAVLVDISPRNMADENDPSWIFGQKDGHFTPDEAYEGVRSMHDDFESFIHGFFLGVDPVMKDRSPEEQENMIRHYRSKIKVDEGIELYESAIPVDNRDAVPKITVPLAYFYAGGGLFPARLANYYRANTSGRYYEASFHSLNHLFFWEMGDEFSTKLLDFLEFAE